MTEKLFFLLYIYLIILCEVGSFKQEVRKFQEKIVKEKRELYSTPNIQAMPTMLIKVLWGKQTFPRWLPSNLCSWLHYVADLSPSTLAGICQVLCLLKQGPVVIRRGEALSSEWAGELKGRLTQCWPETTGPFLIQAVAPRVVGSLVERASNPLCPGFCMFILM